MAWLCSDAPVVEGDDPIIDVQKVIEDWAWNHFKTRSGNFRKLFLKRESFIVDVPMNYYQFEDTDTKFGKVTDDPTLPFKEIAENDKNNGDLDKANPHVSVLSTKYVNDTGKPQIYKFRMERTRKASVNVTCQKGFSIAGEARFKLGVVDGKVNSKFEVTNIRGQSFEQTLLFETSSDINVKERTDCTAMVVFTERETRMTFTVQTKMSMPSGSAPIYIKRKKDNKLFALLKLTNLSHAFKRFEKKNVVEFINRKFTDDEGDTYNIKDVKFITEGIIEGVRLSDQTVKLRALDISNDVKIGTVTQELNEHSDFHNHVGNRKTKVES